MEEKQECEKRNGSAMSIHMALINQEASEYQTKEDKKMTKPRRNCSKARQKKTDYSKLPKLTKPRNVEKAVC